MIIWKGGGGIGVDPSAEQNVAAFGIGRPGERFSQLDRRRGHTLREHKCTRSTSDFCMCVK